MSVQALKRFVLDHYDEGGHWIYEPYSDFDYEVVLSDNNNDLELAKADLKAHWEWFNEREDECRFE